MTSSARIKQATENQATIDNEHLVQLELVNAVVDTVERLEPPAKVAEVLNQFIEFTELHFMSEALLMRLHAYPDYDEHVMDHDNLVARMHELRERLDEEGHPLDSERAIRLKGEILSHIRNRDAALHVFIASRRK